MFKLLVTSLVGLLLISPALAVEPVKTKSDPSLKPPPRAGSPTGVPATPATPPVGVKTAPQNLSNVNTNIKTTNVPRDMVFMGPVQFTRVTGENYNWQTSANNVYGQTITGAVLMPSKYVNGSWSPMGAQQTRDLPTGNSVVSGSGSMTGATKFKLDVMARRGGNASPLEVVGSKTADFTPQAADLTANINLSSVSIAPWENRFHWRATVTNNNAVAFGHTITVGSSQFYNGHWVAGGGTSINQLAAGASSEAMLTFYRKPDSTQMKIVLEVNGQVIKESAPIALAPINAAVTLSNIVLTKQGTVANWSATVTNSGNIALGGANIKTFQRAPGGEWTPASNPQNVGAMAIGAATTAGNMFPFGSSTQFKIEVIASSYSESNGVITVGSQEISF